MPGHLRVEWALVAAAMTIAAPAARANTWDFFGVIEVCNPLACNIAGIGVGDELTGFLTAADDASGPNMTFTEADITDYLITTGEVVVGPEDSVLEGATLTTDAAGELVSGIANFFGTFDGGIFGPIDLFVTLDVTSGTWFVETPFLGLGVIASGTGAFTLVAPDSDGDGINDGADNCTLAVNALQEDVDADGIGDICDADFDQNCSVNFLDVAIMKQNFLQAGDLPTDMNNDGITDFADVGLLKAGFAKAPGPSGVPNLCTP
jgi:hypothetical protein